MSNFDVILSPVITEKSTKLSEANQVVFRVTMDATKPAIFLGNTAFVRKLGVDCRGRSNPIHSRHHYIHKDHIWVGFFAHFKCFFATIHLTNQFNIGICLNKSRQPQTHGGMVINN